MDNRFFKSLLTLLGKFNADKEVIADNPSVLNKIRDTLIKVVREDEPAEWDPSKVVRPGTEQPEENDLEGLSVVDEPGQGEDEDEAAKWLKEQAQEKKPAKSGYTDWKPQSDYSPEHQAAMKEHVAGGFTEREAERLAGAHKGPMDFQSALTHTIKPSQMSDKMHGVLKPYVKEWLANASRHQALSAEAEKNPTMHAEGQMIRAHEEHGAQKREAFQEFLNSDKTKGLKGRDRHRAISDFHKQYAEANPDHESNMANISRAQEHFKTADEARKKNVQERIDHILSAGQAAPGETVSEEAGMQHAGGTRGEEGYKPSKIKDPAAQFAESHRAAMENPEFISKLKGMASPEQMDRFTRVASAKKAQNKVIVRKAPKPGGGK